MTVLAVQQFMLGRIMSSAEKAREALRCIRDAGYAGIELCHFMLHPTPPLVRLLTKAAGMPIGGGGRLDWPELIRESGLRVVGLHADLATIERDIRAIASEALAYGAKSIVVTGMYRFDYGDMRSVMALAERLNIAGAALKDQGVALLYHNHNCELRRVDSNLRAWDILLSETNPALVNFELDTYWIAEAGASAQEMMQTLGARMKLWHIGDRGFRRPIRALTPILKTDSVELGLGNMNLAALAAQAKAVGVEAVILETHRNWVEGSPLRSLQISADFLREHFS